MERYSGGYGYVGDDPADRNASPNYVRPVAARGGRGEVDPRSIFF